MKNKVQLIAYVDRLSGAVLVSYSHSWTGLLKVCSAEFICCLSSGPSTAPMPVLIPSITPRSTRA